MPSRCRFYRKFLTGPICQLPETFDLPQTDCTCGTETGTHAEDCPARAVCTCGTETETHSEDCPLAAADTSADSFYEQLLACTTLRDIFNAINDDNAAAFALTGDEILDLEAHIASIWDSYGDTPTEDEKEAHTELLDMIVVLKENAGISECTCGSNSDVHDPDCPLYEGLKCTCGTTNGTHEEGCPLYGLPFERSRRMIYATQGSDASADIYTNKRLVEDSDGNLILEIEAWSDGLVRSQPMDIVLLIDQSGSMYRPADGDNPGNADTSVAMTYTQFVTNEQGDIRKGAQHPGYYVAITRKSDVAGVWNWNNETDIWTQYAVSLIRYNEAEERWEHSAQVQCGTAGDDLNTLNISATFREDRENYSAEDLYMPWFPLEGDSVYENSKTNNKFRARYFKSLYGATIDAFYGVAENLATLPNANIAVACFSSPTAGGGGRGVFVNGQFQSGFSGSAAAWERTDQQGLNDISLALQNVRTNYGGTCTEGGFQIVNSLFEEAIDNVYFGFVEKSKDFDTQLDMALRNILEASSSSTREVYLRDVVTKYFVVDGDVEAYAVPYTASGFVTDESDWRNLLVADSGVEVATVENPDDGTTTVDLTGYDLMEHFVNTVDGEGEKLVMRIPIERHPQFIGGNQVPTNVDTDSGVYDVETDGRLAEFPMPKTDVTLLNSAITVPDLYLHLGSTLAQSLNLTDLLNKTLVDDPVTVTIDSLGAAADLSLDLSKTAEEGYGLTWQDDYAKLTVVIQNQNGTEVMNLRDIREDQTYSVALKIEPLYDGAVHTQTTPFDAGNITVFYPTLVFRDDYVHVGETMPTRDELKAYNWLSSNTIWKDSEGTLSTAVNMTSKTVPAIELGFTRTYTGQTMPNYDIPVNVTVAKVGYVEDAQENCTFKWEPCDPACEYNITEHKGDETSYEFYLHTQANTGVTITKLLAPGTTTTTTFSFTLSGGTAGAELRTIVVDTDGHETGSDGQFDANGQYTFSLRANESISILDLAEGEYTLTETLPANYKLVSMNDSGENGYRFEVSAAEVEEIDVTNAATGSLNIIKQVVGAPSSATNVRALEFPLEIVLTGPGTANQTFTAVFSNTYKSTVSGTVTTDANGKIVSFTPSGGEPEPLQVSHADTLNINGLPVGATATVTEITENMDPRFTSVVYTVVGVSGNDPVTVTISRNTAAQVSIQNIWTPTTITSTLELDVRKALEEYTTGDPAPWPDDLAFNFILERYEGDDFVQIGKCTIDGTDSYDSGTDWKRARITDMEGGPLEVTFSQPGVYLFQLREENLDLPHIDIDINYYYFEVTVGMNAEGRLMIESITAYNDAEKKAADNPSQQDTDVKEADYEFHLTEDGNLTGRGDFTNLHDDQLRLPVHVVLNLNKMLIDESGSFTSPAGFRFNIYTDPECTQALRDEINEPDFPKCDCGKEVDVPYNDLMYSHQQSCGCQKIEHNNILNSFCNDLNHCKTE